MSAQQPSVKLNADEWGTFRRYTGAYGVADRVATLGTIAKVFGGIGAVGFLLLLPSAPGGGEKYFLGLAFGCVFQGVVVGTLLHAVAQIQRATLDTAVHTSPFLTDDLRSRLMLPGTRPVVTLVLAAAPTQTPPQAGAPATPQTQTSTVAAPAQKAAAPPAQKAAAQPQPTAVPQPAPVAQAAAERQVFFYSDTGTQYGPYSATEMQTFLADGLINMQTLVFRAGGTDWLTAQEFPELIQ